MGRVAYLGYQVITGIAILVLVVALVVELGPSVVGDEGLIVYSGSMAPAIHVGDLAIIRPINPDQLVTGDVVTYLFADQPNVLVTHASRQSPPIRPATGSSRPEEMRITHRTQPRSRRRRSWGRS